MKMNDLMNELKIYAIMLLGLFQGGLYAQNNPTEMKRVADSVIVDLKADDTYTVVEERPRFPGGDKAMIDYLIKNIKYPKKAKKNKIEGTVYVTFVVTETGKIDLVTVLKGIGYGCDDEALRVVSSMPEWYPGKQKGKAVKVQQNLPIKFELKD